MSDAVDMGHARCRRETDQALLVKIDDLGEEVWLPKSGVHDDSEVFDADENNEGRLVVKAWLAEKRQWG